jgi:hypothetical protein
MADSTSTPAAPPAAGQGTGKPPTMGDLRAMVTEIVDKAIAPLREGGSAQQAAGRHEEKHLDRPSNAVVDIDAAVEKALAKATATSAEDKARADHDAEHARLRSATPERRPVDRPKRSRWLGDIWEREHG